MTLLIQFRGLRRRLIRGKIGVTLTVMLVHLGHQVVWRFVHRRVLSVHHLVFSRIANLPLPAIGSTQSSPFGLHTFHTLLPIDVEEVLVQLWLILGRNESTV